MKFIPGLCLCLLSFFVQAQVNLVPNPSFEIYDTCPDYWGQIQRATGWVMVNGSPDYFNRCNIFSQSFSIPENVYGYKNPINSNDQAYAGFAVGWGTLREILGVKLDDTIRVGTKYFISFNLAPAISPLYTCTKNKIGVKLFTRPLQSGMTINNSIIDNSATVYDDSLYTDTTGWKHLSWSFVSDSNYVFLSIGCFFTNAQIQVYCFSGPLGTALFYIDNVCISTDSVVCNNFNADILPIETPSFLIQQYDNGFSITGFPNEVYRINLFNLLGKEVLTKNVSDTEFIDTAALPSGIYIITLKNKSRKLLILNLKP